MSKPILMLAPMAGFTDKALRRICCDMGCDITVTEMVSAKAIHFKDKKTDILAELDSLSCKQAIQLFGSEPDIMAEAALHIEELYHPDFIDINMGCPVKKIVTNGDGSALMQSPDLASDIVKKVTEAVKTPVSVKIRSGWDENSKNAPELAKMLEQSGAKMITVHGRTKKQLYSPPVDIDIIKEVKSSVSVPVIANGGIEAPEDAISMLDYTECDGVALARGALGNPWLFSQIKSLLDGKPYTLPNAEEKLEQAKSHLDCEISNKGEYVGIRESRVQLGHYLSGLRGAAQARMKINLSDSRDEIFDILNQLILDNKK